MKPGESTTHKPCVVLGDAAVQIFSVGIRGSEGCDLGVPNALHDLPRHSPSAPQGATVRAGGIVAAIER